MKIKSLLCLLSSAALLLSGCDKECGQGHPGATLGLPAIKNGTFPSADMVLAVGDVVEYSPEVVTPGDAYYRWYFNGEDVSVDPEYSFVATTPMRSSVVLELSNSCGKVTLENRVIVTGADYLSKYLIINEGWFGHEPGSVSVYDPSANSIETRVVSTQNFGQTLGTTSQSATLWNDKLFVCSKDGSSLTVLDPQTLYVEKQSSNMLDRPRQAYEFIGIDDRYGIITSTADIYRVDYTAAELKAEHIPIADTYGGTGSGVVFAGKLFLNVKGRKIHVIDIDKLTGDLSEYGWNNYFPYTTIDVMTSGGSRFVKGSDGNLYTIESSGSVHNLVRITPELSVEKVAIRSDYAPSSFGAYSEASFCGTGDDFYYAAGGKIYKCAFDDPAPDSPFTTYVKSGYGLYGAGLRVNSANGEVVATYLTSDYFKNLVVRFDGETGAVLSELEYTGYIFPATIIFPETK